MKIVPFLKFKQVFSLYLKYKIYKMTNATGDTDDLYYGAIKYILKIKNVVLRISSIC